MIINNRKDAIKLGRSRYFTGKPCIHGHISERYTSTNGCIGCLRPAYFVNADVFNRNLQKDIFAQRKKERAAIVETLKVVKLRVHIEDKETVDAFVLDLARSVLPVLEPVDVRTRHKPVFRGNDTHVYQYRCFGQHEATLRMTEKDLLQARDLSVEVPKMTPAQEFVMKEEGSHNWYSGDPK